MKERSMDEVVERVRDVGVAETDTKRINLSPFTKDFRVFIS